MLIQCARVLELHERLYGIPWSICWNYGHRRQFFRIPLILHLTYGFFQYWFIHHGRVDVPSMYRPHGRYRYTYGFVSHPTDASYTPTLTITICYRTGAQF